MHVGLQSITDDVLTQAPATLHISEMDAEFHHTHYARQATFTFANYCSHHT